VADGVIALPDGYRVRGATPEDTDLLLELVRVAEEHLDGVAEIDRHDIEAGFERVGFDPGTDCVIILDGEVPVGWADLYKERAEADVHPSHRGRGIGTWLLVWTERRAMDLGSPRVSQTITDANTAGRALFLANGYQARWTAWILQIAFDHPPPVHVPPEGITIRPFVPSSDAHATHRLIDDAFTEWDERAPMPFEEWAALVIRHGSFSPERSRLAFARDELVGAALSFDYREDDEGWVQQVATKATHRNRGIARALLSEVFADFYRNGKRRCGLSTESRTRALGLYERVGMRVRRSYTKYVKQLA
jgi:GNAT superfamily N-acetyltransferase